MKPNVKRMTIALVLIALGAFLAAKANAECGIPRGIGPHASLQPQSWAGQDEFPSASLLLTHDSDDDVSMVGMWHVVFTAKGNVGPGLPPDGAPVDNSLSQWHSDGTEITVSSRVPATGDVCLGVWEKVGHQRFKLNHFGISFDPATDPNNPQGFANIRQDIVLSQDGKTFVGRFTVQQYDLTGNLLVEIKGLLSGTRVNLSTTVGNLL